MSTTRVNEVRMLDDIGKANFTFDSVRDLKDSTQLKVGQKVRTLGYYEPGDGGGNDYEIVAAGTGTDDGGSFIDLAGSGLQVKGLFYKQVSVLSFGVSPLTFDLTTPLRAAIDFCVANGFKRVVIPDQYEYILNIPDFVNDAVINVPAGITVSGDGFPYIKVPDLSTDRDTVYSLFRLEGRASWIENLDFDANHGNQLASSVSISFSAGPTAFKFGWRNINSRRAYINLQTNTGTTPNQKCTIRDFGVEESFGRGIRIRYTEDVTARLSDADFDLLPTEQSASYFEVSNSHRVQCTAGTVTHSRTTEGVGFRIVNGSSYVTIFGGHSQKGLFTVFCTDSRNCKFVGTTGDGPNRAIRLGQSNPGYAGADNNKFIGLTVTNIIDGALDASIGSSIVDGSMVNNELLGCTFHLLESATFGLSVGGEAFGTVDVSDLDTTFVLDNPATPRRVGQISAIERVKSEYFISEQKSIPGQTAAFFEIKDPKVTSGNIELVLDSSGLAAAYSFRVRSGLVMIPAWKTSTGTTLLEETTGPLTGTTGTDGRVTISADTDGIWIENRTGSSTTTFTVKFSCLSGNFVQ